jgi:hypothetical protein
MLKPNEIVDYEIHLGDFPSFTKAAINEAKVAALQLLEENTPFYVERNVAGGWTFVIIDQEWVPFNPEPPQPAAYLFREESDSD